MCRGNVNGCGRRIGGTIAHVTGDKLGTRLVVVFEYRRLHLLKIVINLEQVSFCAKITHGWQVVWLQRGRCRPPIAMTADGNHRWCGLVFGSRAAVPQREELVKGHKTISNGLIRTGVQLTSL